MGTELKKALSWKIDNFSEKKHEMNSDPFSIGGCQWCLQVYPKGYRGDDDLTLFVRDADPGSLRPGWKRRAMCRFVLLNQSGQELYRSPDADSGRCKLFCSQVSGWGYGTELTLSKLQEKGLLENDQLIFQVYMNVLEVVHQGKSTENELLDYHGVHILASQCHVMDKTLALLLDVDPDFKPKKEYVSKSNLEYTKLIVGLVQRLIIKSPQSLSLTELKNVQSDLAELAEAGFKVDCLRSNLEKVSLVRKKELSDGSRVQQLDERVKNVELALSDLKSAASAALFSSFELIDLLTRRFFLSCFSISKH